MEMDKIEMEMERMGSLSATRHTGMAAKLQTHLSH